MHILKLIPSLPLLFIFLVSCTDNDKVKENFMRVSKDAIVLKGGVLYLPEQCAESSNIEVVVTGIGEKPEISDCRLHLVIDNNEYQTYKNNFMSWNGNQDEQIKYTIKYEVELPSFQEYSKNQLPVRFDFYIKDKVEYTLADTLKYLKDSVRQEVVEIHRGSEKKFVQNFNYYDKKDLDSISSIGEYFIHTNMTRKIKEENDHYKILVSGEKGWITHKNTKEQISIPEIQDHYYIVDKAFNLKESTYTSNIDGAIMHTIKEEDIGKYPAYKILLSSFAARKKVFFNGCERIDEIIENAFLPTQVDLVFVDYPEDTIKKIRDTVVIY